MKLFIALVVSVGAASAAQAQDWSPVDSRSRALGGAGVAFADGRSDSMYWNPAALAFGSEKPLDFSTGWGMSLSFFGDVHATGDIVSSADRVADLYSNGAGTGFSGIQNNFNTSSGQTDAMLQAVMQIVDGILRVDQPGAGVISHLGASALNIRVGPFGLFLRAIADVGMDPFTDFSTGSALSSQGFGFLGAMTAPGVGQLSAQGIALSSAMQAAAPLMTPSQADTLAYQAQLAVGAAALANPQFVAAMVQIAQQTNTNQAAPGTASTLYPDNPSGVRVRALAQFEAGIAFGMPLLPTLLDVGIAVKVIHSEASFVQKTFADRNASSDFLKEIYDDLKANRRASNNVNFDLGARVMPLEWLTVSLSARNLIPMDIPVGGGQPAFHQDPALRLGAMVKTLGFIRAGFDVDLFSRPSMVIDAYRFQNFGIGVEFDLPELLSFPFMIIPRVGYSDNLAMSQESGWLTAGFGIKIFAFFLDLAAQMSLDRAAVQSSSANLYPTGGSVSLTFGVNFPF